MLSVVILSQIEQLISQALRRSNCQFCSTKETASSFNPCCLLMKLYPSIISNSQKWLEKNHFRCDPNLNDSWRLSSPETVSLILSPALVLNDICFSFSRNAAQYRFFSQNVLQSPVTVNAHNHWPSCSITKPFREHLRLSYPAEENKLKDRGNFGFNPNSKCKSVV